MSGTGKPHGKFWAVIQWTLGQLGEPYRRIQLQVSSQPCRASYTRPGVPALEVSSSGPIQITLAQGLKLKRRAHDRTVAVKCDWLAEEHKPGTSLFSSFQNRWRRSPKDATTPPAASPSSGWRLGNGLLSADQQHRSFLGRALMQLP